MRDTRSGIGSGKNKQQTMKQYYEAMYILDIQGKEEGVDDMLSTIRQAVESLGGEFKTAQRMDRRRFERVAGHLDSGYYLGVKFDLEASKLSVLKEKFQFDSKVYRQNYIKVKPVKKKAEGKGKARAAA